MNEWMIKWMNWLMNVWVDERYWRSVFTDNEWMNKRMNNRMDEWMNEWMNWLMNVWVDERYWKSVSTDNEWMNE